MEGPLCEAVRAIVRVIYLRKVDALQPLFAPPLEETQTRRHKQTPDIARSIQQMRTYII